MLCPDCKCPVPGGALCPQCGNQVPERESFGGQGNYYLIVLSALSLLLLTVFFFVGSREAGLQEMLSLVLHSGWLWFYILVFLTPIGTGFYYWALLREEEMTITDDHISRRSNWGDEHLAWSDVREFRRKPILFRDTRLGRVTGLTRLFASSKTLRKLPPICYELWAINEQGNSSCMRLEPGTIDDMPWLLQLVQERVGPPLDT